MKLIKYILLLTLFVGCKKENPQPKVEEVCNCGLVQSDDVNN